LSSHLIDSSDLSLSIPEQSDIAHNLEHNEPHPERHLRNKMIKTFRHNRSIQLDVGLEMPREPWNSALSRLKRELVTILDAHEKKNRHDIERIGKPNSPASNAELRKRSFIFVAIGRCLSNNRSRVDSLEPHRFPCPNKGHEKFRPSQPVNRSQPKLAAPTVESCLTTLRR
jgi:hypothetical protein